MKAMPATMTEKLYRSDGYVSEFEAEVTVVDGDCVVLGGTAFFPGGGGQVCDTGAIGGVRVTEVREENGEILHKVPGHTFKVGDKIWCSVDWDRRYDLMKGHTAEHLLFSSMKRAVPELNIVKIYISPESKYTVVDADVPWDKISEAVCFANRVIDENQPVRWTYVDKDHTDGIRGNFDKIEDEKVSVVEIGDVDASACCGVHVMETSEIGAIFVTKKVSAGKEGYEIHFEIGQDAIQSAVRMGISCHSIVEIMGSKPADIEKSVQNMANELSVTKKQLKYNLQQALKRLKPSKIGNTDFYWGVYGTSDTKQLSATAETIKSDGGVALFMAVGKTVSVILTSGVPEVDCREVLNEAIVPLGGRGGGKPGFAQGGIADNSVEAIDRAFDAVYESVRKRLV